MVFVRVIAMHDQCLLGPTATRRRCVARIMPRTARIGCATEELVVDVVGGSRRLGVGVSRFLGGRELLIGLGEAAEGECAAGGASEV